MEFNPYLTLTPNAKLEDNFNVYVTCTHCKGLGEIKKNNNMISNTEELRTYYRIQGRLEQLNLDKATMNSDDYWKELQSLNTQISILEITLGITKTKE